MVSEQLLIGCSLVVEHCDTDKVNDLEASCEEDNVDELLSWHELTLGASEPAEVLPIGVADRISPFLAAGVAGYVHVRSYE